MKLPRNCFFRNFLVNFKFLNYRNVPCFTVFFYKNTVQTRYTTVQISGQIHLPDFVESCLFSFLFLIVQIDTHCQFRSLVPGNVLHLFQVQSVLKASSQKCVSQKMWRNLKVNTAFNRSIPSLLRRVGFSSVYAFPHRPER